MGNVYIYNKQNLITKYYNMLIQIKNLILDIILLGYEKIRLYFSLKNSYEKVILNLNNIFLFFFIFFNLISLSFLNIYKKNLIIRIKYCIIENKKNLNL